MTTTTTKLALIALIACTSAALAVPTAAAAPGAKPTTTGRATIKGVDYYYEIRGKGEPLLLLHGGLMSTDMFGPVMPMLTKARQVIAVDLQGHGRTTLGTGRSAARRSRTTSTRCCSSSGARRST